MPLPPELLHLIGEHMTDADVARMRGTDRRHDQVFGGIDERRRQTRISRGSLTQRKFLKKLGRIIEGGRYESVYRLLEQELPAQVENHAVSPVDLAVDLLDLPAPEDLGDYWPEIVHEIWRVTRTVRSTFINEVVQRVWESTNSHIEEMVSAPKDRTPRSAQNLLELSQMISRKMTALGSLLFDEEGGHAPPAPPPGFEL